MNPTLPRLPESMARSPILLIDDNRENLDLLEHILEWAGFVNVTTCSSGKEGLRLVERSEPHAVILDLNMPGMNGYEVLELARAKVPNSSLMPILVFTADVTPTAKIRALQLGASDFLTKPGDPVEIQLRLRNFLKARQMQCELQTYAELLEAKVRQKTEAFETAQEEAIRVVAHVCEFRDDETGEHGRRVGELCQNIASYMGALDEEFIKSLRLAAPLHDVGKVAIPDDVLRKAGPLSNAERETLNQHPKVGGAIFERTVSPLLQLAKEIALHHHERWDGAGYPAGLSGERIPLSARIVAVADAFDAITNDRPYRSAKSPEVAIEEIRRMSGSQFDPAVVDALSEFVKAEWGEMQLAA